MNELKPVSREYEVLMFCLTENNGYCNLQTVDRWLSFTYFLVSKHNFALYDKLPVYFVLLPKEKGLNVITLS